MTKYEWETELKKNVHRLPADEIKRVLEYYGELFEDMAERGKSEREIINEFGNPVDVADKILSEYEGELENIDAKHIPTDEPSVSESKMQSDDRSKAEEPTKSDKRDDKTDVKQEKSKNVTVENGSKRRRIDFARLAIFILFNVFTGGAVFIVIGAVWIVLASLVLSGAACVISGGVAVVSSFVVMGGNPGAGTAQLGVSVAIAGLGILLAVGCNMLIMFYARFNKFMFVSIKKFLTVKEG